LRCGILACGAVIVLLALHCGKTSAPNPHTVTGAIAGALYNPNGTPAVGASVRIYPATQDPRSGKSRQSGAADSITTDSNGRYEVTVESGTYNVIASGAGRMAYQGSIPVPGGGTVNTPADTLQAPGTIHGVVRLFRGDDPRTVFILFLGAGIFTTPDDTTGRFSTPPMAEGVYRVRLLTTLQSYQVMDTTLTVRAGIDSVLTDPLEMIYTGIPRPTLDIAGDTMKQIATLRWSTDDRNLVAYYDVYRRNVDSNTVIVRINQSPVVDTVYVDPSCVQDNTYEYRVSAVDRNESEGMKSDAKQIRFAAPFAPVDSIVRGYGPADGCFGWWARGTLDSAGNFYITDLDAPRLQKFDPQGNFIYKVTGFRQTVGVAIYADSVIFVTDQSFDNGTVTRLGMDGHVEDVFTLGGQAWGTSACIRSDTLFVPTANGIEMYTMEGVLLGTVPCDVVSCIIPAPDGTLLAVDDMALYKISLRSGEHRQLWGFDHTPGHDNQAQICWFNGDTLALAMDNYAPHHAPSHRGRFYLFDRDGNLIMRCLTRSLMNSIAPNPRSGLVGFSPEGKIYFFGWRGR
jgi:hypothetical protein